MFFFGITLAFMNKPKFKSVFLSDIHLGTKGCQADILNEFLKNHDFDNLFLVGDIIDGWRMSSKTYWPQEHVNTIRRFLHFAKKGTKIFLISGNHDDFLRKYQHQKFGNITLAEEAEYISTDGTKYLIIHGDQFDLVTTYGRYLALLGDWIYTILLRANIYLNGIRRRFGYGYWSLSNYLKQRVKTAVNFISDFEIHVSNECKKRGFDGVICGHIHRAEISEINGIKYKNCGDWVESCTALVENLDGSFEIIDWAEKLNNKIYLAKVS